MPYALMSPVDGERPGWRYISNRTDALSLEAVVAEPPGESQVWDEASGALRERTEAERVEERAKVEERAAEKEFERQMLAEYSSVTEMVADLVANESSRGPRAQVRERLARLREKRGGP